MTDRRCTSDSCLVKATRTATLDLPLANVLINPRREWGALSNGSGRVRVARDLQVDWNEYNQDRYLFSHCTIVSSVATEKNGYHIVPACSELVNNNGNAWTNEVLMSTFRTFMGAENYLEHVQIPELSKGKIIDAVLRPVRYKDAQGREADVYYCDILVATNKKHDGLVRKIASGEMGAMSMGCLANYVTCSRCGKVLGDNDDNCEHIESQLLQSFVDEDGVERVVAELCGRMLVNGEADPESVKFIEASWVDRPAFKGAVLNHFVGDVPKAASILQFPTAKLAETVEDLFKMRVADTAGMIVLRVAQQELIRRRREDMVNRVATSIL